MRLAPTANHFDSRALAYLKMKSYTAAIADYNKALQIEPKLDSCLYGHGLAKRMTGEQAECDADIHASEAITPDIAVQFGK